jgi:D-serine deaminase-like pyridoxal phosphate-dependent protein
MERPVFQPVGTPVDQLDTPAFVVDLDLMERNIRTYQGYFLAASAKVRPVVTSHLSPQIARRQLAAGGTVDGVAVTTVGEAEVFANAGFDDILLANQVVSASKIRRLCALSAQARITVAVDSPDNVAQLSQAASASGVQLGVLVEIEAGMGRCGVAPDGNAVNLAKSVNDAPGLRFDGIMATVPGPKGDDPATHAGQTRQNLQVAIDAKDLMESAGLSVPVVSVGGAHCYAAAGELPAITEVRAGPYPLMDVRLQDYLPELSLAASVLATVISHPVDGLAVLDAGHKATGPDQGLPVLAGAESARATRFSAEHGIVELDGEANRAYGPGEKARLYPYELGTCINQYDYIRAVRNGKLEGFWPLSARGRFA